MYVLVYRVGFALAKINLIQLSGFSSSSQREATKVGKELPNFQYMKALYWALQTNTAKGFGILVQPQKVCDGLRRSDKWFKALQTYG